MSQTSIAGIQTGCSEEEYQEQLLAWEKDEHDRELLECLAIISPTFNRAMELLDAERYQDEVNEIRREEGAALPPSLKTLRIRSQRERAEILFKATKDRSHGTFLLESDLRDLVGPENLSQVISLTRKMLSEENIILLHKSCGGYYLLNDLTKTYLN